MWNVDRSQQPSLKEAIGGVAMLKEAIFHFGGGAGGGVIIPAHTI